MLRACRSFGRVGTSVLAENRFVELVLPRALSAYEALQFGLSVWKVPNPKETFSARPMLRMNVTGAARLVTNRLHYLSEFRDMHFLIRYLLSRCRTRELRSSPFVNIEILRTTMAGLCEVNNAADSLFLGPIYPFLNGEIGKIAVSILAARGKLAPKEGYIDLRLPLSPESRLLDDRFLTPILEILPPTGSLHRWQSGLAEDIWSL